MLRQWPLRHAAYQLQHGGVIAYPTEAIYGLGCDPDNLAAVQRILDLKQRPWHKGLILLAADFVQLSPYILPLSAEAYAEVAATWPGPVTWLLPARPQVSRLVRGDSERIAVRVTAHAQSAALARQFGKPLISTSANISQQAPAKTPLQVRNYFGTGLDGVLHGALGGRDRPSEIRELGSGRVLRG
jgi:L-threonylcarbamoyladenylate synthase